MNPFNIFWLVMLLACVSCGKNESESGSESVSNELSRSNLVGDWRVVHHMGDDITMVYTLKNNGDLLINGNLGLPNDDPFGGDLTIRSHWHFARLDESRNVIIFKGMKSERFDALTDVSLTGDRMVWMSLMRDTESGQLIPDRESECILERVIENSSRTPKIASHRSASGA